MNRLLTFVLPLTLMALAAVVFFIQSPDAHADAEPGQAAPAFTLPNLAGEDVSLSDFAGQTVVLHWQSMRCPWDIAYQPLLNGIANAYADQDVVFLAINSNRNELDVDALASYAGQHEMPYAILKDVGNGIADAYGAQTTPHMFIINGDGELVYAGGIEEAPQTIAEVGTRTPYLVPVLDALLAGEELPYTQTTPKGCSVKRE